jgi:hypothetical protein
MASNGNGIGCRDLGNLAEIQVGLKNARNYHIAVLRVQGAELLEDEEQEDDHRASGVFEVLQPLPQAHAAQGNEVSCRVYPGRCGAVQWQGGSLHNTGA